MLKRRDAVRRCRFHTGRVLSGAGFVTRSIDPSAWRRHIAPTRDDSSVAAAMPAAKHAELRPTRPPLHLGAITFRPRARGQPPQILETVDAGVMAIVPTRLQGVTANDDETVELKARAGITDFGSQDVAEHIRFATAGCARTRATQ